jgi:menaquinol-cytochrome c reductase iron-sulfur subunit
MNVEPSSMARRRFLARLSLLLSTAAAAIVGMPVIGFFFAPLLRKPPRDWRPVGQVDQFGIGTTVAVKFEDASPLPWSGLTAQTAAWLRRVSVEEFVAFSVNCTHLGCPVRWLSKADLFMCPCHGGVYYEDGDVAAGPPPRPLVRYPVRVRAGRVEVRTSPVPIAQSFALRDRRRC